MKSKWPVNLPPRIHHRSHILQTVTTTALYNWWRADGMNSHGRNQAAKISAFRKKHGSPEGSQRQRPAQSQQYPSPYSQWRYTGRSTHQKCQHLANQSHDPSRTRRRNTWLEKQWWHDPPLQNFLAEFAVVVHRNWSTAPLRVRRAERPTRDFRSTTLKSCPRHLSQRNHAPRDNLLWTCATLWVADRIRPVANISTPKTCLSQNGYGSFPPPKKKNK